MLPKPSIKPLSKRKWEQNLRSIRTGEIMTLHKLNDDSEDEDDDSDPDLSFN